jgi:hypothetical protein
VEQTDRRLFRKCLAFVQGYENERLGVSLIPREGSKFDDVLASSKDAVETDNYA